MQNNNYGSKKIASIAIKMALTESREEENERKEYYNTLEIKTAAVDFGGEYLASVKKIIERTIVAAKRENVIKDIHSEEGAVAGAATALFLAPKSGREMREDLAQQAEQLKERSIELSTAAKDKAVEFSESAKDKATELTEAVQDKVGEAAGNLKQQSTDMVDKVKTKTAATKEEVEEKVQDVKEDAQDKKEEVQKKAEQAKKN